MGSCSLSLRSYLMFTLQELQICHKVIISDLNISTNIIFMCVLLLLDSKFTESKQCLRNLITTRCSSESRTSSLEFALVFDDYNPFCQGSTDQQQGTVNYLFIYLFIYLFQLINSKIFLTTTSRMCYLQEL